MSDATTSDATWTAEIPEETQVEPWRSRLELLALLLVAVVVVTLGAAVLGAWSQSQFTRGIGTGGFDLISVVQFAGARAGLAPAGALVVAFLITTLGPGSGLGGRGVLTLRSLFVVGLGTAGLAAFSALATLIDYQPDDQSSINSGQMMLTSGWERIGTAAPLVMAAVLALAVAWCALSELSEIRLDAVVDAEEAGAADGSHASGEADDGQDPGDDPDVDAG